jgi:hypothetical protein
MPEDQTPPPLGFWQADLLNAFRAHYHHFLQAVHEAITSNADSNVLARLGDDLDEYLVLVNEVSPQTNTS